MSKPELKRINPPLQEGNKGGTGENTSKPQLAGAELAESGNIDKIRDILFGAQSRDIEKRIMRLEERSLKETMDLREELKKRFDSLEAYAKKEIESLADRLKSEQDERAELLKELSRELRETSKSLEKKISQLDEQSTKNQREVRQQILDQSKILSDELRQKYEALLAALNREVQELRNEKIDRSALGDLFTELGMRVNNEFKLPGHE